MKKIKQNLQRSPAPPANDHPTGFLKQGSMRPLFSLMDPPPSLFRNQPLFHSYDLAELNKELARHEGRANENGHPIDAEQLQEQIRILELLHAPKDGLAFLTWEFEQNDALQSELIYLLARQGKEKAFESFDRKIYEYFWSLKQLASDGHEGALRSLATLAIEATEVVNRHAVKNPATFTQIAAEKVYWPFLKSPHKKLEPVSPKTQASILKKMQLGKNTQQNISSAKRYDPKKGAKVVALKLLDYVRGMRGLAEFLYREKSPCQFRENPDTEHMVAEALSLPDMTQGSRTGDLWWRFAKRYLLESYPALDPKSKADLNAIAPTLLKLSQEADPNARRRKILVHIEEAFREITEPPPAPPASSEDVLKRLQKAKPEIYKRISIGQPPV